MPFAKGNIPWNKGKSGIYWKEYIEKLRNAKLGKKLTEIHKIRIGLAERDEKHWNWKGGRSKPYKHQNTRYEYKNWRRKVFERDNYTCQKCGDKEYETAHHIKGWTLFPELRYEINNGQTLCESCHALTDNYKAQGRTKSLLSLHS